MDEVVVHDAMERAALDRPAPSPATRPARIIYAPRHLRAVAGIGLSAASGFPADRAARASRKPTGRPLTAPAVMLGEDRPAFLAAEVLASSVHSDILCPARPGCRTWNLSPGFTAVLDTGAEAA